MDDQFTQLARHPHVVIGTPGRIIDHMRAARPSTCRASRSLVLDEADQMLDIGFLPDIEYILRTPRPAADPAVLGDHAERDPQADRHLHARARARPRDAPERVTADKVDQKYIAVDRDKKTKLLAHFIETFEPEQMVVFCRTKAACDRVAPCSSARR